MLRICRSIVVQRILAGFSTKKYSTANVGCNVKQTEPETNYVKLIGTTWNDTEDLLDGDKSCKVIQKCITQSGTPFSITHRLTLQKKLLVSTGINGLKRGQRLNVNGYIRSIPFKTFNGKSRHAVSIIPQDIELYNEEEKPAQNICIVMLTAHIITPIWYQENLTLFSLQTHVPVRDPRHGFTGQMIQYLHTVIVYDRNLQNYVRNNLNRYEKVFIEGYLNYQKCKIDDCTNRMSGNIVALHIEKTQ